MKRTSADIDRLTAELLLDGDILDELLATNERAHLRVLNGASDSLDFAALGYTIHNIYGVMENACLRISKFFENGLPPEAWHRELLNRMLLDLPKTRPAFLDRDSYLVIDELRGFRHVFRNLYNRPLDPDRLSLLQKKVPIAIGLFKEAIERYEAFLSNLKVSLED